MDSYLSLRRDVVKWGSYCGRSNHSHVRTHDIDFTVSLHESIAHWMQRDFTSNGDFAQSKQWQRLCMCERSEIIFINYYVTCSEADRLTEQKIYPKKQNSNKITEFSGSARSLWTTENRVHYIVSMHLLDKWFHVSVFSVCFSLLIIASKSENNVHTCNTTAIRISCTPLCTDDLFRWRCTMLDRIAHVFPFASIRCIMSIARARKKVKYISDEIPAIFFLSRSSNGYFPSRQMDFVRFNVFILSQSCVICRCLLCESI